MSDSLVLDQISKLPPLPPVAHRLVELVKKDDCSADDVTRVLSSDQVLAGKILKLANSPFYGMSGKVATISRAVVILGFTAVRNMALGLGLTQAIKQGARMADLGAFWSHALHVGTACRTIALHGERLDPEELFIAGLLHDLGRLILDLARPGYERQIGPRPPDQLLQAEAGCTGLDHASAGRQVARHWRLPERLADVMGSHHDPDAWRRDESNLIAAVMLGDLLARCLGQSRELPADPPDPTDLARRLGLPLERTGSLLEQTRQDIRNSLSFLEIAGVDTAAVETVEPARRPSSEGCVVLLSEDPQRIGWLHGQFTDHGWLVVDREAYLDDGQTVADLAAIDPRSLPGRRLDRLLETIAGHGTRPILTSPSPELERLWPGIRVLPPAICRSDLADLSPAGLSS